MKCMIKWLLPMPLNTEQQLESMVNSEPEYETLYYKGHDGIGHQWVDTIKLAKEFYCFAAAEEVLTDLDDHNYRGVFGIEESINNSLTKLTDI